METNERLHTKEAVLEAAKAARVYAATGEWPLRVSSDAWAVIRDMPLAALEQI